jgi:DNA-binding transcriptional MerR regulator
MRIGELAKRTGVSTSRIRFYEKHDVVPKAIRGENGYRKYPDTAVKMLNLIDGAQRLGFSLREKSRRPQRSSARISVALGDGQGFET